VYGFTKIKWIILIVSIFLTFEATAQNNEIDFQTWSDFTFTYIVKNRTNIGADLGVRGVVSKNDWNQFYLRPTFQYFFNRTINAAGGVAFFITASDILKNTTEFRVYQEIGLAWPQFEYVEFSHRIRFEQRFFTYEEDALFGADLPNDYESRVRYQLSFETIDLGNKNRPIYFLGAWELFYSMNDAAVEQFINNQRILGGLGHRLSPAFNYEIQYIFQKSRRLSEEGLKTSEHLLRLRLFLLLRTANEAEN
jgi:hypothetical protein